MDYLGEETYPEPPSTTTSHSHPPQPPQNPQQPQQQSQPYPSQPQAEPQTPTTHSPLQPYTSPTFTPSVSDPYNGMPPPPEAIYPDLPTLMAACQEHGRRHGYACVTSSNNYKRGIAYVRCDRGGEYVNHWNVTPENRIRKNRTRRLVGCKWKARAKRVGGAGEGSGEGGDGGGEGGNGGGWQLTMMEDKHSGHGPSEDLSSHPSLRQLPEEAVEEAKRAFAEQKAPKEVLESLKVWNPAVTPQDVYNLKAKIARRESGGTQKATPLKGRTAVRGRSAGQDGSTHALQPSGNGETVVDPALRVQDPNVGSLGQLTAAVAQMQEPQPSGEVAVNGQNMTNGQVEKGKCSCKCCEH